jgi:hypothetical protein
MDSKIRFARPLKLLSVLTLLVACAAILRCHRDAPPPDPEELIKSWSTKFNSTETVENESNCILSPAGFTSKGGGENIPVSRFHGDYVYSTITETLSIEPIGARPVNTVAPDPDVFILVIDQFSEDGKKPLKREQWQSSHFLIELATIDIGNFETEKVASLISEAMLELSGGMNNKRFVLNMSWLIVPCNQDQITNLDSYINAICQNPTARAQDLEKLINEFSSRRQWLCSRQFTGEDWRQLYHIKFLFSNQDLLNKYKEWAENTKNKDSLLQLLKCFSPDGGGDPDVPDGGGDVDVCDQLPEFSQHPISIAAAGNESRQPSKKVKFPFAPALWGNVLSVSAYDASLKLANYSNYGEVKMDGDHPTDPSIKGTSFAAPRLSVYAAIHLAQGGASPCAHAPDIFPPLGYMPERPQTPDGYKNMWLDEAVSNFCNDFKRP